MSLQTKTRKIYDAVGAAYGVSVLESETGDIQKLCLYDADGNPVDFSTIGGGGGLTDEELRATPVPVSGPLTASELTAAALATAAKQDLAKAVLDSILTALGLVATSANQTTIIGHVDGIEGAFTTLNAKDFATQTTLAALNAKITACNTSSVTIGAELPAGTKGIGKLIANDGVDIGDVTINNAVGSGVYIRQGTGANIANETGGNLAAAATSLAVLDDWDESDRCKTNTILKPNASGGLTLFRSIDLDESEEEVKNAAGQVYGWYLHNAATATRYFKFYNATAANVTVGTTAPVLTLPLAAGASANVFSDTGIAFSTAITVAATTGVADADTGAPGANECICNLFYA